MVVTTETLLVRGWAETEDADPSYVWVTMRRLRQKVEVDPNRQQVGAHGPHHGAVHRSADLPQAPVRVVVADDQELVRSGFAMIVDAQPDLVVVGEAADGVEAVALTAEHRPDLVLMDVRMPRMNGLDAAEAIAAAHPDTAVVVLTTFGEDAYIERALSGGADGFVLKTGDPHQLVAGLRAVADGVNGASSRSANVTA
jgi:DNA-binding response OmpR family regulator